MHWNTCLPEEYMHRVRVPVHFERHEDASVRARKVLGFDERNLRCFYFHEFLLTEECFDEEEAIFEVDFYHEMTVAWKTNDGSWIKLKAYAEHSRDRSRQLSILPIEVVDEKDLGR